MSAVSNRMRKGWFSDPEDWHGTYRMQGALRILATFNAVPEWEHSDHVGMRGTGLLRKEGHVCDYRCKPVWPEWVTDEVFDKAYAAADAMQTARGGWNKHQAYEGKIAREKAEREKAAAS